VEFGTGVDSGMNLRRGQRDPYNADVSVWLRRLINPVRRSPLKYVRQWHSRPGRNRWSVTRRNEC